MVIRCKEMRTIKLIRSNASRAFASLLCGALISLQAPDRHRTPVCWHERTKVNKLIIHISRATGWPSAVVAVKLIVSLSIFFVAWVWRRFVSMDGPVGVILVVMCFVYTTTVINNYAV